MFKQIATPNFLNCTQGQSRFDEYSFYKMFPKRFSSDISK